MGAIAYKKTPLSAEDEKWDAGEEVKAATVDDLKVMCTIVDGDPENKTSYKLPHHKAAGDHACVWAGVRAAAAVLQGGRGGVEASAADIEAAKAHIAKHYADFDKGDPPWAGKSSFTGDIETRCFPVTELRAAVDPSGKEPPRLTGHAAVFNQLSEDLGGFREQITPGAFKDTLRTDDIRALFNHDANMVLGRMQSGTLRAKEDKEGVAFEVDVPDTQCGRDLLTLTKRGDISQCSFSFTVPDGGDAWEKNDKGEVTRTLNTVKCMDLSPVTFPAYPQTSVKARSYIEALKESSSHKEDPDQRGAAPKEGPPVSLENQKRQLDLASL